MKKRKICVITGTRAEYGLLYWLMKDIQQDPQLELELVVTGMHLSPEFGLTYKAIEQDGFVIKEKVEMLLSSDSAVGITKSIGLATIGFAEVFERLKPDIIVLLGDRYEILAAAQAALIARIPIAHIAGGDTTEGAFDEAIRHSITKMSHVHFVTNEVSARRVRQLGENPDYIFTVGSPGIDQIKRLKLLKRTELEKELDFKFLKNNLVITFHPVTLENHTSERQFQELFIALDNLNSTIGLIFTKPNSDPDGRIIIKMIDDYVSTHSNAKSFSSLGQLKYLSLLAQVDAVVGNSSSGLYEAPSFKIPTVNIGDRQKGRLQASSIINCEAEAARILEAINQALTKDCSDAINPYGNGDSSSQIITKLKQIDNYQDLLKKHFFEVSE